MLSAAYRFQVDTRASIPWIVAHLVGWSSVSGRWTLARLTAVSGDLASLSQPRYLLSLLALLFCFLLLPSLPRPLSTPRPLAKQTGLTTLFFAYVAITALWAPPNPYTPTKLHEGLLLILNLGTLTAALLANRTASTDGFIRGVAAGCLLLALAGLPSLATAEVGRLSSLGGGPNAFARNCGIALLCLAGLNTRIRFLRSPLIPVGLFALVLLSGSRGGLLATAIGVLYLLVTTSSWSKLRPALKRVPVVLLSTMALVMLAKGSDKLDRIERRLVNVSFGDHGDINVAGISIYSSGRGSLFETAFAQGLESPLFGNGLASFMALTGGAYPHNLFLELFTETGLLGVMLALLALAPLARRPTQNNGTRQSLLAVALLSLTAAMFSGDLYDSRNIWLFLLVASARPSDGLAHRNP